MYNSQIGLLTTYIQNSEIILRVCTQVKKI